MCLTFICQCLSLQDLMMKISLYNTLQRLMVVKNQSIISNLLLVLFEAHVDVQSVLQQLRRETQEPINDVHILLCIPKRLCILCCSHLVRLLVLVCLNPGNIW